MAKERVCLAYSGGLDTSCILAWLLEKGYEVSDPFKRAPRMNLFALQTSLRFARLRLLLLCYA